MPDRTTYSSRSEDNRQRVDAVLPYPEPVFPQDNDKYNPKDPAYSSSCGIFNPTIRNNSTHSGYGSRKYLIEGAQRPSETESADYP